MNKRTMRVVPGLLLLALVAGCGPIYRTEYSFVPPQGPYGLNCIMQCEQLRNQCRTNEDYRLRSCEDQNRIARLEYDRCIAYNYDTCWDNTIYCGFVDYRLCDQDYRGCYQNCGGIVTSREICVSNCDQQGQR